MNKTLADAITFYLNRGNNKLPYGNLALQGTNTFDNTNSAIQFQWDTVNSQQTINQLTVNFPNAFDTTCTEVMVTGQIVIIPNQGVAVNIPVPPVPPENMNSKNFTIYCDIYQNAQYLFEIKYFAIGG